MEPLQLAVIKQNNHWQQLDGVQELEKVQINAICVATDNNVYDITLLARLLEFLAGRSDFKVRDDSHVIVYLSPSAEHTAWVAAGGVFVGTLDFKSTNYQFDFNADYCLDHKTKIVLMPVGKLLSTLENTATAAQDKLYLEKHLSEFLESSIGDSSKRSKIATQE